MDSNTSHIIDLDSQENFSLRPFNTFGISSKARRLIHIRSEEELKRALSQVEEEPFVLGGGSNILLLGDISRTVLKIEIKHREIIFESDEDALVSFGAGENWHECVLWSLDQGLNGLENLSLIPGTIGAAPMQNIGAYGVELADVFHSLIAVEKSSGISKIFYSEDCNFGYRDSFFKQEGKNKYIITKVLLNLRKDKKVIYSYASLKHWLDEKKIKHPTPSDISKAVIHIRKSKLPDVEKIGSGGSFFKNPVIGLDQFKELQKLFPNIVSYPVDGNHVKLAAGWLIDQSGWKGHRSGDAACYEKQALVLVNYGEASGQEIWDLAREIQRSVHEKFGVNLEPEVNIVSPD